MFDRARHSLLLGMSLLVGLPFVPPAWAQGPTPGQNVNMVSGTQWPGGDPFLQRQNESAIAVSTRNFLHLLAGANDYRTVDLPYPDVSSDDNTPCPPGQKCAEPWVGVFKSRDGGETWQSVLLPGYPQDVSPEGMRSPLKKFTTASDPVVRAGTNGLFYYSGIAFNRGTNNGVVFVARFMDLNNKENGNVTQDRDSVRYVDTVPVASGTSTQFLDKPVIAVDVPRGSNVCNILVPQEGTTVLQSVPAGNVYLAYTSVTNPSPGIFLSQIYLTHSTDCGATWSSPTLLSRGYAKSQGAIIQIDPETGIVFVAWRVFAANNQPDSIVVAAYLDGFALPGIPVVSLPPYNPLNPTGPSFFDQATTGSSFRTSAFPTLAVGDSGIPLIIGPLYLAWSQRGVGPNGDARIMMLAVPGNGMISQKGIKLPTPFAVDNGPLTDQFGNALLDEAGNTLIRGHQFMPQLTINGGKLTAVFYDQREDHTLGLFTPNTPFVSDLLGRFYEETRQREGELPASPNLVFTSFLTEAGLTIRRHTIGVRLAEANVSLGVPQFTYANVTQFRIGDKGTETGTITSLQELQVNPPNLPLFQQGTVPFIGDYLDIAGLSFLPPATTGGRWKYNRSPAGNPVNYATWTSNQDVRAPADGDWTHYTPVGVGGGRSIFDPSVTVPNCVSGQAGMRNQNIYASRITQGLLLSSPQTSKPLSGNLERAFVITIQNLTNLERSFRLTLSVPTGVYASFLQVPNPPVLSSLPPALVTLDVTIPAHSGIARSVFAFLTTSANSAASITVNAVEITTPVGGIKTQPCTTCTPVAGGLTSFVILNPEGTVPPLVDPDGAATGISNVELYSSTLTNPNPSNPNPSNPNPSNPNPSNPNPSNPNPSNPNPSNPNPSNPDLASLVPNPNPSNPNPSNTTPASSAVANSDLSNPNPSNPNPSNPNPSNTNLSDQPVSDATYTVTNSGDTSASYHVVLVGQDPGHSLQLIITKTYETPTVSSNADGTPGCALVTQTQTTVQSNIINPVVNPNPSNGSLSDSGITDGSDSNATFQLRPHEQALITLRGFNVANDPTQWLALLNGTAPVVVSQAANTNTNTQTVSVPGGIFIITAKLNDGVVGQPYSQALSVLGGTSPLTWTVSSGSLPPGYSLDSEAGIISNSTPGLNVAGTYPFTIQVTDSSTPTQNMATKQLSIRVVAPLTITTTTLPPAVQGVNYSATLQSTGGTPPITWNLGIVGLPLGLLFGSSGTISGQAASSGTFGFQVQATDSSSPPQTTAPVPLSLTVFANTGNISFVQQPTLTGTGQPISPAVTVRVIDNTGAVIPEVAVTVAIGNNPSGGVLSGTATVFTDSTGVATFSNLSIDKPGVGYTLIASAAGAGGTSSNSFSVTIPPNPPTALQANIAPPNSVILTWTASRSIVAGYNVYRGSVSGGPYTKLTAVITVGLTYTDVTGQGGQTYFYVVTAVDSNNVESGRSNEVSVSIPLVPLFFGQTVDPLGDALGGGTNPDLTWGSVTAFNDGTVKLSARYATGTFNSSQTEAIFLLDTDQNVTTGSPGSDPTCSAPDSSLIGVDYVVLMQAGLGLNPVANQATIFRATGGCNNFAAVGTAPVIIFTDGVDVTFPLSLLTNTAGTGISGSATAGPWNFKVLSQFAIPGVGLSGITDTMPNAGLIPASTGSTSLPIPPPSGMLAWWPADGYPTDIQAGHGIVIGAGTTFAPSEVGQSFAFDGLTGFITITDNGDLTPAALTVDFWFLSNINLPDPNHPEVPFIMKLNPFDDANAVSKGYDFFYQFGAIGFGLPSTPSGARTIVYSSTGSTAITAGTWHHVAGTYDSSGQKLYLDGSLVASGPNFGPIQYQAAALQFATVFNTANFSPGVNNPNFTYFFNGQLDEIEIHNRALSASEIQAIFNAGSAGKIKP